MLIKIWESNVSSKKKNTWKTSWCVHFSFRASAYLQINQTKINVLNINVLQINGSVHQQNLLKYRTKCHLKMLCRSMALYINHCWSKNHISFILFHRSIIICLLCLWFQKHTTKVSVQNDFLTEFGIYYNYISTFEGCLHCKFHDLTLRVSKYHFSKKSVELQVPKIH
jgi:hypothetical protein